MEGDGLEYISTEQLIADVRLLATQLPAQVSGVAGIPRSGMLAASWLSLWLHVPLYELSRPHGLRPLDCGLRLGESAALRGPLVVVDDSVCSGWAMTQAKTLLKLTEPKREVMFVAVYPRPETVSAVDLFARAVPAPHLFEWNLFNCNLTDNFAFDFDGVLCDDWRGNEEDEHAYCEFLAHVKPRWLPRRRSVKLIVTARLERHREATFAWLTRHHVRVEQLVMGPWSTTAQRAREYSAGRHKGEWYARSACWLFIESDDGQAREIFESTGKPVLCPANARIYQ
jgi:uncharacterized HAD superfamily protein